MSLAHELPAQEERSWMDFEDQIKTIGEEISTLRSGRNKSPVLEERVPCQQLVIDVLHATPNQALARRHLQNNFQMHLNKIMSESTGKDTVIRSVSELEDVLEFSIDDLIEKQGLITDDGGLVLMLNPNQTDFDPAAAWNESQRFQHPPLAEAA